MNGRVRLTVIMEWNEAQQKWLMKMKWGNIFVYDFWDCGTVQKAFKNLNKDSPQTYIVEITHEQATT